MDHGNKGKFQETTGLQMWFPQGTKVFSSLKFCEELCKSCQKWEKGAKLI
jgi:hypothetical protein